MPQHIQPRGGAAAGQQPLDCEAALQRHPAAAPGAVQVSRTRCARDLGHLQRAKVRSQAFDPVQARPLAAPPRPL